MSFKKFSWNKLNAKLIPILLYIEREKENKRSRKNTQVTIHY